MRQRPSRAELEAPGGRTTLQALMRTERAPMPWRRAVSIALDIALDLARFDAQRGGETPALTPDGVLVSALADGPLGDRALVMFADEPGAAQRTMPTLAPIWCPPAQADGAPFDAAANRYVLGLMLYRLLSGTHPFSGSGGLRRALEAAQTREVPAFHPAIAKTLPAGLEALVLRLLDNDPARREGSARAVAEVLAGFEAQGRALEVHPTLPSEGVLSKLGAAPAPNPSPAPAPARTAPAAPAAPPPPAVPVTVGAGPVATPARAEASARNHRREEPTTFGATRPPAQNISWAKTLLPILIGAGVAAAMVTQLEPAKDSAASKPTVKVGSEKLLGDISLDATDCASCHARQVSEWRRSVMGHSVKSPLFNALESLIEEQVGRDFDCPNGAGILRRTSPETACRDRNTGLPISGSGGEHWCVNCHSPSETLQNQMPVWQGLANGDPRSRFPVRDIVDDRTMEGISCGFCHQVHGPVNPRSGGYQGNATWTSFLSGRVFESRPEDRTGSFGIANSGYDLQPLAFLLGRSEPPPGPGGAPLVHKRPDTAMKSHLRSSEFCGACHDVRLFGSDVIGAEQRGEHFKRLRNAYSEWRDYVAIERRKGRTAASCQDCHMSAFPGVCTPDPDSEGDALCPPGTDWQARAPGRYPTGRVASSSETPTTMTTHYLTGVDLPLSREYPEDLLNEESLDLSGIPISAKLRRNALLKAAFDFDIGQPILRSGRLTIPVQIENTGAGHRIPAGFSQEREIWVHLVVKDRNGRVVYEVGRVDRNEEDLHDKVFLRVNTDPSLVDGAGRPIGLFGADVADGPDKALWSPPPEQGGTSFVGKGLINFQNGFLRCVTCIGTIDFEGKCQPLPGQERARADRFADGDYDLDEGTCRSNLSGQNALFETYFPVGALDASRGALKAPDAIIDTRSIPPSTPLTYTYDLDVGNNQGPFSVRARLMFRAFPPFLIRAFADYERQMDRLGRRPSGPLVDEKMFERLDRVEIARVDRTTDSPAAPPKRP